MNTPKQNSSTTNPLPPVLAPPVDAPPKLAVSPRQNAKKLPAWMFIIGGFISGIVIAVLILIVGFGISPPQAGAQATFTIDWNQMPGASEKGEVQRMRKVWRELLAAYMSQEQGETEARKIVSEINHVSFSELLSGTRKPPVLPDEGSAVAAIKRGLRVTTVSASEHEDQVVVKMADYDTNRALVIVEFVVNQRLSDVTLNTVVGSFIDANANQKGQDIEKRMDSIRDELLSLSAKIQAGDRSFQTSSRYRELQRELENLGNQKSFNQVEHLLKMFDPPVSVTEPAHIVLGSGVDLRIFWTFLAIASVVIFPLCGLLLAWLATRRR